MLSAGSEPRAEILFTDQSVVVCIKPAGMDSQEALPALLRGQIGGEIYCVHRLDRDVGGVMLYARSSGAAAALSAAIGAGKLEKTYLAVCGGTPEPAEGEMRDLLFHDTARNKTFVVTRRRKGVREALLRYRVLRTRGSWAIVQIRLLTGRSHQIRVQFASRGMPLLGDARYGSKERTRGIALWSAALAFPHPDSGEVLRFSVPPPSAAPWNDFMEGGGDDAQFPAGSEL